MMSAFAIDSLPTAREVFGCHEGCHLEKPERQNRYRMEMRKAFFAALATATWFTSSAWSQTISGSVQEGLTNADGLWNHHPFALNDSSTGVFRFYWSCGNPDGICVITGLRRHFSTEPSSENNSSSAVCDIQGINVVTFDRTNYMFAEGIPAGSPGCSNSGNEHAAIYAFGSTDRVPFPRRHFSTEPISVNNPSPAVCDIQDPGVVMFNGTYYLFAEGIPAGSPGCSNSGNEHAAIYAFRSTDGVSFSPLNGGNPVIKVSVDPSCYSCYTGHGISFPSPVVMGSGSFIRVYYHHNAPGYGPIDDGILAMDTYDGVTFFNERVILTPGWAPSVKRVGLSGDFPMVITYATGSGNMAATSSWSSDTSWTIGNNGMPISTNPAAGYPPSLEGDQTGLFLNANGVAFTSPVSGQLHLWWSDNFITGSRIYRGLGNAAQFFIF